MAYRAETLDTSTDMSCQPPAELPPLGLTKSLPQGPVMLGHVQHSGLQVGQLRSGFPPSQDTGLQTVTTLPGQHIAVTHGGAPLNSVHAPMKTEPLRLLIKSPNTEEEGQRDQERRIRREIANSNERRRMQSINAGFKSLKTILPHTDGEKLSKAAILQQTSEYITQLESDKLKLLHQNEKLRRAFADCKCNSPKHRALVCDIFDKDEGIGSPAEEDFEDMRRGIIEVRQQLDKERRMRMLYEEKIHNLEAQMYPDKFNRFKAGPAHRTSSDERASSSEYSPSAIAQESHDSKLITCARPLLPPLTPVQSKVPLESATRATVAPAHITYQKSLETRMAIKVDPLAGQSSSLLAGPEKAANSKNEEIRLVPAVIKEEVAANARQGHTVTVFSHSTKSNQPLKKRAIEIHQNYTEITDQSVAQQPKCKVAKITSEPAAEIGTRSFLPPTLPPISLGAANLQPYSMQGLPRLPQDAVAPRPAEKGHVTLYPQVVATVPSYAMPATVTGHSLAGSSLPCQQPAAQATKVAVTTLPVQAMLPAAEVASMQPHPSSRSATVETMGCVSTRNPRQAPPAVEGLTTYAVVHSVPNDAAAIAAAGVTAPVYLTVENVKRHLADQTHSLQPREGIAQSPSTVPKRHLVVAPVQPNPGTVLVDAGATQRQEDASNNAMSVNVRMVYHPHALTQADKTQNLLLPQTKLASVQEEAPRAEAIPVGPMRMTSVMQPHAFQCSNLPKLQNSLQKIQSTVHPQLQQTVLCYRPPEITLNQLNAVPNLLPPPRSLHQPLILSAAPSLAQALSSASPSYVSPALQDPAAVLPARFQTFPEVGRRRKSSLSATDSCSTASISGAEEEDVKNPLLDDPDCQSEDSVPTIKLCSSDPVTSPSSRRLSQQSAQDPTPENVAAYKEVPQGDADPAAVDVPDSGQSPSRKNATLSVLSDVAGSPPVIRRIDAIQTRRNLETIVQAIDHLEQQERRNSQDHSSAPESSPKSAQ